MKHSKTLYIVRHAKAAWDNDGIADIDRSLKGKGKRQAYEISRKLKLKNQCPQRIIASPADRALHTAVIFARVFEFPLSQIEIQNVLYASSTEKILDLISSLPDAAKSVMIFGHNPEFTDLANHFMKTPVPNLPTCGVIVLKFACQKWKDIDRQNLDGQTLYFPAAEE
jgi:phosphohistidine phosphatase